MCSFYVQNGKSKYMQIFWSLIHSKDSSKWNKKIKVNSRFNLCKMMSRDDVFAGSVRVVEQLKPQEHYIIDVLL
jgi:hypothetical protein